MCDSSQFLLQQDQRLLNGAVGVFCQLHVDKQKPRTFAAYDRSVGIGDDAETAAVRKTVAESGGASHRKYVGDGVGGEIFRSPIAGHGIGHSYEGQRNVPSDSFYNRV